ncbi:hypothetical protein A9P82_14685 [Arachidicoccus ginsenosidimutans]|uniref:NRAMP family divalent metal transporter n=1 Tax=Arachidicoccus sp. BS20 TaxID=1850526 RepID=UPI0007F074B6|nr:NRAMP family divalent metal transporter [Arachidicoccus sp. BS20]ANI90422.1 hypothetical protein A9P82_14685 [Arachidicoccus sp. BS20]
MKKRNTAILGAAFLMATSAIGPAFLTQTSLFTSQLAASFGFVIFISILLDLGAQLNLWRIVTMSKLYAQDMANELLPGAGYFLAALIAFGGFAFNIGNIAGAGLGLNVLTGLSPSVCGVISCCFALSMFWFKEAGRVLDFIFKALGILTIALTVYVAFAAHPPLGEALHRTVMPGKINFFIIVTIVGGTVGGYISFAGAHRLLDAGVSGRDNLKHVTKSSVSGILITAVMRYVLFLAALGVVVKGIALSGSNPAASVFQSAAGSVGYIFFGVILWSASITSIIGSSYTTVSFWRSLSPFIRRNEKVVVTVFIIISCIIFLINPKPVKLLIMAGAVNGFILPIALAIMLIASRKKSLMNNYKHSLWLQIFGWIVVLIMNWLSIKSLNTFL